MKNKKSGKKSIFRLIIDIITWTIFALLMIVAFFLIYYVIATNIYARKGEKFKPIVSLYSIMSGSMLPTIEVYDVVMNLRIDDASSLKEGDIITFISPSKINYGMTVTHRIDKITYEDGTYYFTTKGDNNPVPDSTPVTIDSIIGKVILKFPSLGKAQFFLLKLGPGLFLVLIPAIGVLIYDILKAMNLFGTKQKVSKSLETKEYKLSSEEQEKLKNEIKTRLIAKEQEENEDTEQPEEETKALQESKDVEEVENDNIDMQESTRQIPISTVQEDKPKNITSSKQTNKNTKAKKTNSQSKSKTAPSKNVKKNYNNSNNKNNQNKKNPKPKKVEEENIDVDKVLQKIKEKKY